MARRPSRLLSLCHGSWIVLITQIHLIQSNYFVARHELEHIQVSQSVICAFTVRADSLPPNTLLAVNIPGEVLLPD